MRHKALNRMLAVMCMISLTASLTACGDNVTSSELGGSGWKGASTAKKLSGEFAGAGASSQKSAVDAWIAGFAIGQKNVAISYDPSGSGAGVNTFLTGAVTWAGTDAPLTDSQVASSKSVCAAGTAFDIPVYISPIAVTYNLSDYGLNGSNKIQMSASTIAKIFNGTITKWNDEQIKKENPKIASKLPDLEINPIWRSDKSGTTKRFQEYLDTASHGAWKTGASETWPNSVGQGAKGTSGVVLTVSQAQGTIGYADAAQTTGLGTVKVKVGNTSVKPTAKAVSRLIEQSKQDTSVKGKNRYVVDVDYTTTDSKSYPIALVSYDVACAAYSDDDTAEFVKQWLIYSVSAQGQKVAQNNAGSAPISAALRKRIMKSINAIQTSSGSSSSSSSSSSTSKGDE